MREDIQQQSQTRIKERERERERETEREVGEEGEGEGQKISKETSRSVEPRRVCTVKLEAKHHTGGVTSHDSSS